MHRPALIAFTIVVLAGCSQGSDTDASAPTAPARPAPRRETSSAATLYAVDNMPIWP